MKELSERDEFFYAVIAVLNEDEDRHYRGGLFYGGELGCCLIWWDNGGRWERKWYDLEYPFFPVVGMVGYTVKEDETLKDKFFARATGDKMPWKVIVGGAVKAEFYDKSQAEIYVEKAGLQDVAKIEEVNGG